MNLDKNKTCCFTGHRPNKTDLTEENISLYLENEILNAIEKGFKFFITGMSKGFDLWAAKAVLKIKEKIPEIRLICAVPYDGFDKYYDMEEKIQYDKIIKNSDALYYVCQHYSRYCFQLRNKWMIDNSNLVIAMFSGKNGGTKNSIEYAKKQNVQIANIIEQKNI